MSGTPILHVQALEISFTAGSQVHRAVEGISFDIGAEETVAIVGESGSGKSVTALSMMGLLPSEGVAVSGSITLEGEPLLSLDQQARTAVNGRALAMIYQETMSALNPLLSIGTQLYEAIHHRQGCARREADAIALRLCEEVGLGSDPHVLKRYPFQLSGGQRQRVMIAMAFAARPKLLIADEPTTALDVSVQAQILALMRTLRVQHKTSVLLITHDLGVVAQMAERVLVMYAGCIVESAPVQALFDQPHHPYTQGLMAAIPRIDRRAARLYTIPGQVPRGRTEAAVGCLFCARCPKAMSKCTTEAPPTVSVGAQHTVQCHLYAKRGESYEDTSA